MNIKENIESLKKEIELLSDNKAILLAATKTRDAESINEAIRSGITDIGENKVQELLEKYDDYDKSARLHFIGKLQTNKVRKIIDKVYLIHSVDTLKLVDTINRISEELNIKTNVLLQVNKGEEENKSGFRFDEVREIINTIDKDYRNINILGLMAVVPNTTDEEVLKKHFTEMRKLFDQIREERDENFKYLSMGMSNDYKIAIECGSNIVRIGTKIFGERVYK